MESTTKRIPSDTKRFRDRKVGTKALNHVLNAARDSEDPWISSVYLHVQVSNEEAKRFYHRNGFVEVGLARVSASSTP